MGRVEFSFRKQVSIEQGRKLKFLQPYSSGSNVTLRTTVDPKFGQNDLTPVLQCCIARAVAQLSLRQGLAIELASIPRLDNRPRFAFASRHFSRSPAAHTSSNHFLGLVRVLIIKPSSLAHFLRFIIQFHYFARSQSDHYAISEARPSLRRGQPTVSLRLQECVEAINVCH